jgi:hypothetical protein
MEDVRISAKQLGELALPYACQRCLWIKVRVGNKLPYQVFPGIFSTIDSYNKKLTAYHFNRYGALPEFFKRIDIEGLPVKVPSFHRYQIHNDENNVLLTGVPDEIIREPGDTYYIIDYKTSRYTKGQDKLLPLYRVQLNAYAYIGERIGFEPVRGLGLFYFEPRTDISEDTVIEYVSGEGFNMNFKGSFHPVELDAGIIPPLLGRARELYDSSQIPPGRSGCKDCERLDHLLDFVG